MKFIFKKKLKVSDIDLNIFQTALRLQVFTVDYDLACY